MIDESDGDYLSDQLARQGQSLSNIEKALSSLTEVLVQNLAPQAPVAVQPRQLRPIQPARMAPRPNQPSPEMLERAKKLLGGEVDETYELPEDHTQARGLAATVSPVGEMTNPRAKEEAVNSRIAQLEASVEILMNTVRLHGESLQNLYGEMTRRKDSSIIQGVGF